MSYVLWATIRVAKTQSKREVRFRQLVILLEVTFSQVLLFLMIIQDKNVQQPLRKARNGLMLSSKVFRFLFHKVIISSGSLHFQGSKSQLRCLRTPMIQHLLENNHFSPLIRFFYFCVCVRVFIYFFFHLADIRQTSTS